MPGLDIFDQRAFSLRSLTAALLDQPHIPRRLGELGIFESNGITTTDLWIERQENTLVLVPVTPRNAPATTRGADGRDAVPVRTHRIALEDAVTADEVQNVRAFGSESDLQTVQSKVNEKMLRLSNSITATEEYHRIGAVKGTVLDADGSTLVDLGSLFGVVMQPEVGLDIANVPAGQLRNKLAQAIIRPIEDELGGLPYSSIHVMCSSEFFDDIAAHTDVQDRLKHFPQGAQQLAGRVARGTIEFGGCTFEEYRGSVGGTPYVAADKAHAFPIGVPELFITRYAPAEFWETVNTIGLPRYARMRPDPNMPDSRRMLTVQSQAAHICTRPRTLIPLKRGA